MRVRYLYFGAFLMVVLLLVAACGGGGGGGVGGSHVRDNNMSGGVVANTGAQQEKQTEEQTLEVLKSRLAKEDKKRRLATVEAEKSKLAAVKPEEARRLAAVEAEKSRLAAEEAEKSRLAAAEKSRLAAVGAKKSRLAAEEAEKSRLAAVGAEKKKLAAVEAEKKKLAAVEAEESRLAAAEAEKSRLAAAEAEKRRLAAAEKSRLAAVEAKKSRLAAEEAEKRRLAAEEAVKRRLAAVEVAEARMKRASKVTSTTIRAKIQAACASGGSADGSSCSLLQERYDRQVAEVAQEFRSRQYRNQWGLSKIRADVAYADVRLTNGRTAEPGAGVKVGILVEEFALDHRAFAGRGIQLQGVQLQKTNLSSLSVYSFPGGPTPISVYTTTGLNSLRSLSPRRISHGTAVASVIIARPDAWDEDVEGFQGVAWGSDLKVFVSGTDNPAFAHLRDAKSYDDGKEAEGLTKILSQVDIIQLGSGDLAIIDDLDKKTIADFYGKRIEAWTQADKEEKTILVWGAGDMHGLSCLLPMPYIPRHSMASRRCEQGLNRMKGSPLVRIMGGIRADSVNISAGIPLHFPELREHTVASVAIDENGEIASFSNRCGSAADWCIAAPGTGVSVARYQNRPGAELTDVTTKNGTAYSASMVSGALAVMKGVFGDQLSNTDLVVRLFATANKTGRYADEKIYGQGLLDLGAATSPVGEPVIVVVGSIVGGGVPLTTTSLASGKAFGDSLLRSVAGEGVVTFDALGAPFSYDLGGFVGYAKSSSLQERLQTLMDSEDVLEEFEDPAYGLSAPVMTTGRRFFPGGRVSRTRNGREASGDVSSGVSFGRVADKGHLSVAKGALMVSWEDREGGLSATAFGTAEPSSTSTIRGYTTTPTGYPAGHAEKPHTSGGVVAWQPSGAPIGLRAGWMTEQGSVLGASGRGAFGSLTGQTGFVGLHTGWKTDTWSVHANAEFGTIASTPEKSLIKDISGVITSTFGLSATRSFGAGRALQVSLSQPLRVESGRASFVVPVARTKSGSVVRRSFTSGLSPSGRQIDFSLSWHHRVSDSSRVHLSGILTHNPGHRANAKPEAALLLGWKHSF